MPLTPGEKLGPYEITALVGKGGMGEVYKAHDSRLGRDVALKVSAKQFTERFEREAKAIAALNHPNICTLYDVGPNYLVMEFVEGASPKGPMPLDEAMKLADQIAAALEAAHEKNITHRDLKPGNIMVRPDGTVKVLDFGLAKIASETLPESDATLTMGGTLQGAILGTPAYMAPEQARGKPADRRADIWAFGVVLYELITGKRLFQGEDLTEILASVVKEQPDLSVVPAKVRRLLEECLAKDPAKRLQAIGDRKYVLGVEPRAHLLPGSGKLWPSLAAAATLALLAVTAWSFYPRAAAPNAGVVHFTIAPPDGATLTPTSSGGPQLAVSPDGRYLAFVANETSGDRTIWVRALGSLSAQKLDKTDGASFPFWSPDSQHIAFFADNQVKRIPVSGGSPVKVADAGGGDGGAWFQDTNGEGVIVFAARATSPLQRVPASGGVPAPFTKLAEGETAHIFPQFLPDGKRVLYWARGGSKPGIYVQAFDSEERTFVRETPGRAMFSPPNFLLFVNDGTLMAQHFDPASLKVEGEPVSVADEVRSGGGNGRSNFSISSNGVLAYRSGGGGNETQLSWYTRDGKPTGIALAAGPTGEITLSPDDKLVAVRRGDIEQDLWLLELATGAFSRLTSGMGTESQAVWAPDSRRLAFAANTKGPEIHEMVIGSGKETTIFADGKHSLLEDWTDGKQLLIRNNNIVSVIPAPEEGADGKAAERKAQAVLTAGYTVDTFSVSPDGKWVAYMSQETGRSEINVAAFPAFTDRRQISTAAGLQPLWRADGKELFFLSPTTRRVMAVDIKSGAKLETGPVRELFPSTAISSATVRTYAVTRDGQRFLVVEQPGVSNNTVEQLYVIANWPALVK